MAKRNVSEIEIGAGLFIELVSAVMKVAREKAVPFAAIYRLATADGRMTLAKIVDLAYTDWQAEQLKPIKQSDGGHSYRGRTQNNNASFSAKIVYIQPEFEDLMYYQAYVDPEYKGKRFDPIERCESVSKENREVIFEYVHMDRNASTDEVIAEMDCKGLRPALYEELIGFAKSYPDEQRKYPIVALGSVTLMGGYPFVACLWVEDSRPGIFMDCLVGGWQGHCRFLAVRK